jgi:hypothetical protein
MAQSNHYASIAIVEIHPGNTVTIETVSVTDRECLLSGAWDFSLIETEKITNVLSGKMIIPLGQKAEVEKLTFDLEVVFLDAASFLNDAKRAADGALIAYETFKSENLNKRKNLVSPEFYNWPADIDFNSSAVYLNSIGKIPAPSGTPDGFKATLSAANLVKHLIDMWHLDEQERNNRKYVEGEDAKITILPESWLEQSPL